MLNVTIIDKQQSIWGAVHGSVANRMIAALSEEPATIDELKAASTRFEKPRDVSAFDFFYEGICEEAYDAGVLIIDLKCRVVAGEQTYFALTREGEVKTMADSVITLIFTAVLHKEENLYVAECPEVGTVSQGYTVEEAVANLKEATELYLEEFPPPEIPRICQRESVSLR